MSASTSLTSLTKVKAYLGISDTDHDTSLTALIDAASEAIELYCGREFADESRTEQYDGRGGRSLVLRCRPVASITSVHDDPGLDFGDGTLIDASEYTFYPSDGVLALVSGRRFMDGVRNVRIVYSAGYGTIPPAIEQAANVLVSFFHHRGHQGADGIQSENVGSYVVSYDTGDWPHQAKGLLAEFREMRI